MTKRVFSVREEVINCTSKQWDQVNELLVRGVMSVDVYDFYEVVGLIRGLSAHFNDEEQAFFDALFAIDRDQTN